MSNHFLNVKEIARSALPRLMDQLVFPALVHTDYSADFQSGKGGVIQVRKPVVLSAEDFDESSGVYCEDVNEGSVEVCLDKLATVDVEFGAVESAVSVDDLNRLFIAPAAAALAEKINSDGLKLCADIPYFTGTAGTTPDGLDDFAAAARVLNEHRAPMTDRAGVWDPAANAAFQQLPSLVNAEKSGTTRALRAGSIGKVFGIENYMSQAVKKTAAAKGAGTVAIDKTGGYSKGDTLLHVDGVTTAFEAGDQLKLGGLLYTVKTAGTLSSGDQDLTLSYGLLQACADNDPVTPLAAAVQNLVFHKNAFAFVTRPLCAPAGVESYTTTYNGITLRVCRGYDMKYKKDMLSMDVLYGFKTLYPELAVRVLG